MRESVRVMGAGGISGIGVGDRMGQNVYLIRCTEGNKLGNMSGDVQAEV